MWTQAICLLVCLFVCLFVCAQVFPEVMELRTRISVLETERDTLKQHMEELRPSTSSSSSVTSSATPSFQEEGLRGTGDAAAERLVNEERLKWQVEVVNVRRELEEKLERERRGWKEKGEELKAELAKVKGEVEEGRLSLQQVGKLQTELKVSQQRLVVGREGSGSCSFFFDGEYHRDSPPPPPPPPPKKKCT